MVSNLTAPLPNIASPTLNPFLIGMGSQKKIDADHIISALHEILQPYQAYAFLVAVPAFKQNDLYFHILQQDYKLPIQFISFSTLTHFQPQCQSFSKRVYQLTGLGAISEACLLAIMQEKDHLLIPKMIYKGITISLARKGSLTS